MSKMTDIKAAAAVLLSVAAFALVVVSLYFGLSGADSSMNEKMTDAVQRSVMNGAVLCYSMEGAYPESISYLVDNYGIRYDSERYIVHYRYVAVNIRPDIVVLEKGADEG